MNALVSVITPAYNRASFLSETIDSILKQSYQNFEYIILDDGSTDRTSELLEAYHDPKIRKFYHPNMGESQTVNKGLSLAQGDIICVVNSDDSLLPGAIEEAVKMLNANPEAVAVYPDWLIIGPNSEYVEKRSLKQFNIDNMLIDFNFGIGPGTLIRKSVFKKIEFRNSQLRYTGDMDFWLRLALVGKLLYLPKMLATHRIHPDSASVSGTGKQMASEMLSVVRGILNSEYLIFKIKRKEWKILARVYYVCAKGHCGTAVTLKWVYFITSLVYRLLATVSYIKDALSARLGIIIN